MEFENLIRLIDAVSASPIRDFRYEKDGVKLRMKKDAASAKQIMQKMSSLEKDSVKEDVPARENDGQMIVSPLVGTFYSAPGEGMDDFVSLGDSVTKGQTLAIIEAMKLMNEIECDCDGVVSRIFVENGQPVEYGQPLFLIGKER